ncbi:MAG TPA: guanylate kinase [Bacillota bacterium]|nr:guanylate kinase [Bacillota bacterium]
MKKGLLIVLSGPSGVGKGTVCRSLQARMPGLCFSVSATTRPPRPGEIEGRDYYFLSDDHFQRLLAEGAFLEWALVHGRHYGTLKDKVSKVLASGNDLLLEIDIQGAEQVRRQMPEAVTIFMAPPSMAALEQRIIGRGTEDAVKIRQRLEAARREMEAYRNYEYLVVNDEVEATAALLASIIQSEKCRVSRGARPPVQEVSE